MDVVRRAIPIDTRAPGGRTNAYVVGCNPAILVDPPARTDGLDELVQRRGVEHVLVTHTHPDHVGGVEAYATDPDRTVWSLVGHAGRFASATGVDPHDVVEDGDRIELGGGAVRVVSVPGHAPDHAALVVEVGGPILCGDCAVRDGSVVVGGDGADMRAYLDSLARLRDLDPPTLLPGHGPPIDRPDATLEHLIEHRLERERRVRAAVHEGARTPAEVVATSYEKDLSGVEELALTTVVAHLEKLDADGDLSFDGERVVPE